MSIGMRRSDLKVLMDVVDDYALIILVRHTNEASLPYIGLRGQRNYFPKPLLVKAKTASIRQMSVHSSAEIPGPDGARASTSVDLSAVP